MPATYVLLQNYPNPFNPSTTIEYELPVRSQVDLIIYNILGQRVATLYSRTQPAGLHGIEWDGTDAQGRPVASGIYFYRLHTPSFSQAKKMVLLR